MTINTGRHYADATTAVFEGDCLERLRQLPDASVDAVVTDPPYGLANTDPAHVVEALTKWATGERDFIPEGRGFMGKAWDAFVPPPAVWDECLRVLKPGGHLLAFAGSRTFDLMTLSIRMAGFDIRDSIAWISSATFPGSHNLRGDGLGWGTRLKPVVEPVVVARKPFLGTLEANFARYRTGALNIDATRIATDDNLGAAGGDRVDSNDVYGKGLGVSSGRSNQLGGRWPANLVIDERVEAEMGKASRFFYVAKAPRSERPVVEGTIHPTVKPLTLMRYLVKLVTPPGGIVLEPFAGSGTTIEAARLEGFRVIGIERDPSYLPLIQQRIDRSKP